MQAILALLPILVKLGENVYTFVEAERARLKQTGEWTDADEASWQAHLAQRAQQPWQQPQG